MYLSLLPSTSASSIKCCVLQVVVFPSIVERTIVLVDTMKLIYLKISPRKISSWTICKATRTTDIKVTIVMGVKGLFLELQNRLSWTSLLSRVLVSAFTFGGLDDEPQPFSISFDNCLSASVADELNKILQVKLMEECSM